MKKIIKTVVLVILVITIITSLYLYWQYKKLYPSTDNGYIQANIIHMAPQVSGPVIKIYIQNNQLVKKGQPLFDIDPQPFLLNLQAAQAKLDATKQKIQALQCAVHTAKAQVQKQISELTVTRKTAKRILALVKSGQLPKTRGDITHNKLKVATAALTAAKAQLAQAKATLGYTGKNNAQIRATTAALKQAKLNLQHTHVRSPNNGKIINFSLRVGTMVAAGNVTFSIVEQNKWWVDANFKETNLASIHVGEPAMIKLDIYPTHKFYGTVTSLSAGSGSAFSLFPPENATGNWVKVTQRIPVKIVIKNLDSKFPLHVGTSATVTIDTTKNIKDKE